MSQINAASQNIFARLITITGGSAPGSTSKIGVTGVQNISLLTPRTAATAIPAGITLQGGSGAGASALIDPTIQTIVSDGPINITGGSGDGATAGIFATGLQTILVTAPATADSILLQGGTGPNSFARITTSGPAQQLGTSGGITLTPGTGSNADAVISGATVTAARSCSPVATPLHPRASSSPA